MKLECLKDKLKLVVGLIERITGKNLSLPILGAVLLEASDQALNLKATNLDVGVEISLATKVEKKGRAAVSGSVLSSFLQTVNGEVLRIELAGNNLSLSTKNNSTVIKTFPVDDFPTIPRTENSESFQIENDKLVDGLGKVWYAASLSDMKPEISSIYVYADGRELVFVATDSFRLAEKRVDTKDELSFSPILIPYRSAAEIIRLFENPKAVLSVSFDKNQIAISGENIYFTSRLVGGAFPNYRQIMPTAKKCEAVILKKDLVSALKISNIFSDKLSQVSMKLFPDEPLFEITSSNQDTGESSTRLDAVLEGEKTEISFNAKYILDSFQSVAEDSVSLAFNGAGKPMVLKGIGNDSFKYLVMPINR